MFKETESLTKKLYETINYCSCNVDFLLHSLVNDKHHECRGGQYYDRNLKFYIFLKFKHLRWKNRIKNLTFPKLVSFNWRFRKTRCCTHLPLKIKHSVLFIDMKTKFCSHFFTKVLKVIRPIVIMKSMIK